MTFIVGPYTYTYDGSALGISEDGFRWLPGGLGEPIRGDNMGDTIQDIVHRGIQFNLEIVLEEYSIAGMQKILWPWHATIGNHGQAGVLWTSLAKSLVVTAVTGTTASTVPATMTFEKTILDPGFVSQVNLNARLRKVPLRLIVFPNANNVFFTQT